MKKKGGQKAPESEEEDNGYESPHPSAERDEHSRELEGDYFAKVLPSHLMKDDPSLNWFQKPHTVTMFIVAGIIVLVAAFTADQTDTETNVKMYAFDQNNKLQS